MSDYQRLRDAVRANPELPLTWQQVIELDAGWDAVPEKKQRLIDDLERIQETETGQRVLRDIILNQGQSQRLQIATAEGINIPGIPASTRAVYDNGSNVILTGSSLYPDAASNGLRSTNGEAVTTDVVQPAAIRSDEYLLHELRHAALLGGTAYADAGLKTMQDQLLMIGNGERAAEEGVDAYNRDTGRAVKRDSYVGEFGVMSAEMGLRGMAANDPARSKIVEGAVTTLFKYAKADLRLDDAGTLRFVEEQLQRWKADGIDIIEDARAFLQSDATITDEPIVRRGTPGARPSAPAVADAGPGLPPPPAAAPAPSP